MSQITLLEYKDYKDIKSPNNDLKLEPILEFVNSFIPKYCGVPFSPEIITGARVESCDGLTILLPHSNIVSVEELRISDVAITTFALDSETGLLDNTSDTYWTTLRNRIQVDYTHGFEEIPADLKVAAFELVSYFNKGNFATTKTSSTGESLTNPAPTLIPKQIKLMLDMYKCL